MTIDEFPGYVAASNIGAMPSFGYLSRAFGSFFVDRSNKNSCNSTVKAICDRVKAVKENSDVPPIAIFAEGGTSSGTHLLHFKRGAFEPLEPIQPFFIEYQSKYCNPACEVFPMPLHLMFMACQIWSSITLRRMPMIYPTEEMFRKYPELHRVEAYAETMRDIYSSTYGVPKTDVSLAEKVKLNEYVYNTKSDNNTKENVITKHE